MRILVVHNRYNQRSGEDGVFEAETKLLKEKGNIVDTLIFDNQNFKSLRDKIILGLRIFYNSASARKMKQKLLEFTPDVIHAHNFIAEATPSIFYVAKQFGIPVVVTLHNYRLLCPSGLLYFNNKTYEKSLTQYFPLNAVINGAYRGSIIQSLALALCMSSHNLSGTWRRNVSRFIVMTTFGQRQFANSKLNIRPNQLTIKPNFVYDSGAGDSPRKHFFLYAGRLCEEKGLLVLLKAASRYHFPLVITGDGPLRDQVLYYSRIHSNIEYQGLLDNVSVRTRMKACTALIVPSLCFEVFPLSILEAFSTATPAIVSARGCLKDIVRDKFNGLHFNTGDDRDLVEKIMLLQSNPESVKTMGDNARQSYLENYTPEKNYQTLMKIYTEAITESPRMNAATVEPDTHRHVPKVSIGIPTYNGAKRIRRALESVYRQAYPNLEIIVSDNCSSDDTPEVILEAMHKNANIRYFRQSSNIGVLANFDYTMQHATGKYFMWLADDDELEPGCIEKYVAFLDKHDDYVLVSGAISYQSGNNVDYVESGFTLDNQLPGLRTCRYYSLAIYGGMFHGMMRRQQVIDVPHRQGFANDLHFVAEVCYLGKIKNFDDVGYRKYLGGFSADVKQCARTLGQTGFTATFPHVRIPWDAFHQIMNDDRIFSGLSIPQKFMLAIGCFFSSFYAYYFRVFPFVLAGPVKRALYSILRIQDHGSLFKNKSFKKIRT